MEKPKAGCPIQILAQRNVIIQSQVLEKFQADRHIQRSITFCQRTTRIKNDATKPAVGQAQAQAPSPAEPKADVPEGVNFNGRQKSRMEQILAGTWKVIVRPSPAGHATVKVAAAVGVPCDIVAPQEIADHVSMDKRPDAFLRADIGKSEFYLKLLESTQGVHKNASPVWLKCEQTAGSLILLNWLRVYKGLPQVPNTLKKKRV